MSWQWPPGWRGIRAAVFAAKGRVCFWCGAYADTADHHPVPAALGGPAELWNLVPACQRCNSSRGASLGNRMRPRRPLTTAQRHAIALKRQQQPRQPSRSSRDW